MIVYVAHEKHGTFTYSCAREILRGRLEDGYWYDNWDDGDPANQWEDRARAILDLPDEDFGELIEKRAWAFLLERADHEYEYVEQQRVR